MQDKHLLNEGRNATSAIYDHDLPRAALADRVLPNDETGLGTALEVRGTIGSSAVVGGRTDHRSHRRPR